MKLDLMCEELKFSDNYKEWLRPQIKRIYKNKGAELGMDNAGLVIYVYTDKDQRREGYFSELLDEIERLTFVDFWTVSDIVKKTLKKRGWEKKQRLNNYIQFIWQTQDGNRQRQ